ncbi:MAG: 1-acyl-sn-glycerol-3-phosphate acyltransferase [Bacteroidota bacterium]
MQKLLGKLIITLLGWKLNKNVPKEVYEKCVIIAAPHTSNWDYPLTMAAMSMFEVNMKYTIKKEWIESPLGWLFRALGGIGVDRFAKDGSKKISLVDAIANLFEESETLTIIVQPEGTRSLQKKWKTGFYYIAQKAQVPIVFGYLDYKNKSIGIEKVLYPSGDLEADMFKIMEFYKNIPAKFPEKFALDERFTKVK